MYHLSDVVILIPTYNERENLEHLLPQLLTYSTPTTYSAHAPQYALDILIVDDYSPDGTATVVKRFMKNSMKNKNSMKKNKGRVYLLQGKKEGLGKVCFNGLAGLFHRRSAGAYFVRRPGTIGAGLRGRL